MDLKQWLILMTGITGVVIVVLCPRWVYTPHPLMLQEKIIGYRFITQPPKSVQVVKEENGKRYVFNEWIAPRIDRADFWARLGLIMGITGWGLWIVQRLPQIENRRRHWILLTLMTVGLIMAAQIHAVGNTH